MATFKLQINIDNAAFGDTPGEAAAEIKRILSEIPDFLPIGTLAPLRDVNGNLVGSYHVDEED